MSTLLKRAADLSVATILAATLLPLAAVSMAIHARAAEPVAFAIPAEDGYGIAECMHPGSACGAAIAESFCEAHGHHRTIAFGLGADVTGTTAAGGTSTNPDDVLIRCGD